MHWALIFFELLAPFIISMLLLPMIVRSRIRYAYEETVQSDVEMKPVKRTKVSDDRGMIKSRRPDSYPITF